MLSSKEERYMILAEEIRVDPKGGSLPVARESEVYFRNEYMHPLVLFFSCENTFVPILPIFTYFEDFFLRLMIFFHF